MLAAAIALSGLGLALVVFQLARAEPEPQVGADAVERPPPGLFDLPPLTSEITFTTPAEAESRRRQLLRFVFGRATPPGRLPVVERGIEDDAFTEGLRNLERLDRLTIALPLGFAAVAYHVVPTRKNGRLLIYHAGHREDFLAGKATVAYFLERGYSVLVFAMPFAGPNRSPETFETPLCGRVELAARVHDTLACMARPLRYFVEPVAVGLNHTTQLGYERTDMLGLSGGGWTTVLYAALDRRVRHSYPVSGTLPHHVRAGACTPSRRRTIHCYDDFEQRMPALYRIANYLELYALGSWGAGRRQLAVFNVHEPHPFPGTSFERWQTDVQAAVRRLGAGEYEAIGDTTHREHMISPFALRAIEADLARR